MEAKALALVASKVGCLYRWGAEGPEHFDCSGLIMWVLRQLGRGLPSDHNAAMMWNAFPVVHQAEPGVLAFWRNKAGKIFHVAMVSKVSKDTVWCIGAHGGGPSTVNDAIARQQGAMVRDKPFKASGIAGYRALPGSTLSTAQLSEEEQERPPHSNGGEPPDDFV